MGECRVRIRVIIEGYTTEEEADSPEDVFEEVEAESAESLYMRLGQLLEEDDTARITVERIDDLPPKPMFAVRAVLPAGDVEVSAPGFDVGRLLLTGFELSKSRTSVTIEWQDDQGPGVRSGDPVKIKIREAQGTRILRGTAGPLMWSQHEDKPGGVLKFNVDVRRRTRQPLKS